MPASASRPATAAWRSALACAVAGVVLFQWCGNPNRGYIATDSLFWWWGFQWSNPASEAQHGWLILVLSVWLLVRNLRQTPTAPGATSGTRFDLVAPLVAMGGGLALHAVGFAAQQARVSIVGLLFFAWGVVRLGGGRRWGSAAVFPLVFLAFAIPINVLDSIGFWLRLVVVQMSSGLAHAAGIGVVRSGTQLIAPDGRYQYDVAAACSGVRSLMAMAALSLLVGYLQFRSWWRRGLVFLVCFPLVLIGNLARIVAIIFAAQWGGARWGDWAHAFMGYAIFVVVLGGVWAFAMWLEHRWPESEKTQANGVVPATEEKAPPPRRGWMLASLVVLACGGEALGLRHLAVFPLGGQAGVALTSDGRNPIELPMFLGRDWIGTPTPVTAVEREILPPDTGFSRMIYRPAKLGPGVFLSIVLSGRDRTSIHRPELCLVGQGWTLRDRAEHQFSLPDHRRFPVTLLHVERPSVGSGRPSTQLVAYGFVASDRVVAGHWERLAWDTWNRLSHLRADRWAYVLVQTEANDGDVAALARIQSVLAGALPIFRPLAQ